MLDFHLYRIQVRRKQLSLFNSQKFNPSEILKSIIDQRPSILCENGRRWHIGNIKYLDNTGIYFRIGRTTKSTFQLYQDDNFIDSEVDTAPYTHVLLDLNLEICAIAKKNQLARSVKTIANKLSSLLNQEIKDYDLKAKSESDIGDSKLIGLEIDIEPIKDTKVFLESINESIHVTKFWYTIKRPNAFDAHEDFVKPYSRLVEQTNSDIAKTSFSGEELNKDVICDITTSAAVLGAEAGATMLLPGDKKLITKHLTGDAMTYKSEELDDTGVMKKVINGIRSFFEKIRSPNRG